MAKAKISVTVDESLLRACARVARGATRSELVETALARWLRDKRRQALEEEVEQYYASLDAEARRDDDAWSELGGRVLGEAWE